MTTRFTESTVEEAALEWLSGMGYPIAFGADISINGSSPERSAYDQVILVDRLTNALSRINSQVSSQVIEDIVRKLAIQLSPNLLANNHTFHKMLTDGISVEVESTEGELKYEQIWLIAITCLVGSP